MLDSGASNVFLYNLFKLCEKGDVNGVDQFVKLHNFDINVGDEERHITPLQLAAANNQVAVHV